MKLRPMALAAATALALPALAHDTWFERRDGTDGTPLLALGTGSMYPAQESGIDPAFFAESGCRAARIGTALKPVGHEPAALLAQPSPGAATCWVQLAPFEITLEPDKIPLYLRELQASPAQRAAWAAMRSRGLPWRERYTKHARIELSATPSPQPAPLGMDIVIDSGPVRAGATLVARVLRDGRPLAGLPVELRGEASAIGIWRRSDDEGRISLPVPAAGAWLLRAIDLRLSTERPDTWDSRFVTLAFEAMDQNGNSLRSNTRSTSQIAATTAISTEPPISTTRR